MKQKKEYKPSKLLITLENGNTLDMAYVKNNGEDEANALLDSLLRDIQRHGKQRFQEYADLCSMLYEYSPANQMLLSFQIRARGFPVKFIASPTRWEAMGMQLHGKPYKRGSLDELGYGAKAFFVWVPDKKKNEQEEEKPRFALGRVFGDCAIKQGPDPQKNDPYYVHPPLPQFGNSGALASEKAVEFFHRIASYACEQGWSIEECYIADKAWQPSGSMMIQINSTFDLHVQAISLLHALCWHQLVMQVQRAPQELAQTGLLCAYIIGQAFGIEHDLSQQVMEEWAQSLQDRGQEREMLKEDLGLIQRVVKEWVLRIRALMGMPNLIVKAQEEEE